MRLVIASSSNHSAHGSSSRVFVHGRIIRKKRRFRSTRESRLISFVSLTSALSNTAYFAASVAVVFFVSPILVHGLGDSRYGAWLLVNSVLAYMALAELGVGLPSLGMYPVSTDSRSGLDQSRIQHEPGYFWRCRHLTGDQPGHGRSMASPVWRK